MVIFKTFALLYHGIIVSWEIYTPFPLHKEYIGFCCLEKWATVLIKIQEFMESV